MLNHLFFSTTGGGSSLILVWIGRLKKTSKSNETSAQLRILRHQSWLTNETGGSCPCANRHFLYRARKTSAEDWNVLRNVSRWDEHKLISEQLEMTGAFIMQRWTQPWEQQPSMLGKWPPAHFGMWGQSRAHRLTEMTENPFFSFISLPLSSPSFPHQGLSCPLLTGWTQPPLTSKPANPDEFICRQ